MVHTVACRLCKRTQCIAPGAHLTKHAAGDQIATFRTASATDIEAGKRRWHGALVTVQSKSATSLPAETGPEQRSRQPLRAVRRQPDWGIPWQRLTRHFWLCWWRSRRHRHSWFYRWHDRRHRNYGLYGLYGGRCRRNWNDWLWGWHYRRQRHFWPNRWRCRIRLRNRLRRN